MYFMSKNIIYYSSYFICIYKELPLLIFDTIIYIIWLCCFGSCSSIPYPRRFLPITSVIKTKVLNSPVISVGLSISTFCLPLLLHRFEALLLGACIFRTFIFNSSIVICHCVMSLSLAVLFRLLLYLMLT